MRGGGGGGERGRKEGKGGRGRNGRRERERSWRRVKELCWFVYSTWGGRGNAHITTEGMDTHNHKNIQNAVLRQVVSIYLRVWTQFVFILVYE